MIRGPLMIPFDGLGIPNSDYGESLYLTLDNEEVGSKYDAEIVQDEEGVRWLKLTPKKDETALDVMSAINPSQPLV